MAFQNTPRFVMVSGLHDYCFIFTPDSESGYVNLIKDYTRHHFLYHKFLIFKSLINSESFSFILSVICRV